MPHYWPVEIELWDGEETFQIDARPEGIRRFKWLSWIPFQTGSKFIVTVKISASKSSGTRSLGVMSFLEEPDGERYAGINKNDVALPFEATTPVRYLAINLISTHREISGYRIYSTGYDIRDTIA